MTTKGKTLYELFGNEGLVRKEEGIKAVINGTDEEWKNTFIRQVEDQAKTLRPFTSETITVKVGLMNNVEMNKNNIVGALMNACAKRGIIVKTGRRIKSLRPNSHGAELTEWIGHG